MPIHIDPTPWESSTLGLQSRRLIPLKSRLPAPPGRTHVYRFTVEEEVYPDSLTARTRVDSLFAKPPKLRPEDRKTFPLRRAFAQGNLVVLVRTDVAAYQDMLVRLTEALRLAAAAPAPDRSRLLDSLGRSLRASAQAR